MPGIILGCFFRPSVMQISQCPLITCCSTSPFLSEMPQNQHRKTRTKIMHFCRAINYQLVLVTCVDFSKNPLLPCWPLFRTLFCILQTFTSLWLPAHEPAAKPRLLNWCPCSLPLPSPPLSSPRVSSSLLSSPQVSSPLLSFPSLLFSSVPFPSLKSVQIRLWIFLLNWRKHPIWLNPSKIKGISCSSKQLTTIKSEEREQSDNRALERRHLPVHHHYQPPGLKPKACCQGSRFNFYL